MTIKLQVPIDKDLKERSLKRAKRLGFNSLQDLTRVLLTSFADERQINFNEDSWGEPPAHVMKRWQKELDDLPKQLETGEAKSFDNVDDFLADLHS